MTEQHKGEHIFKVIDSDTLCDVGDGVQELHPNLPTKLQNTILNTIDLVAKLQRDADEKALKERLDREKIELLRQKKEYEFAAGHHNIQNTVFSAKLEMLDQILKLLEG